MNGLSSSSYLQALGDKIVNWLDKKAGSTCKDKFDAYMQNGKTTDMFKDMGNDGMLLTYFKYEAVFSIESFPANKINPNVLIAIVTTWLDEFDASRKDSKLKGRFDLKEPDIDIDAYDNATNADIEIVISFVEPITLIQAPDGEGDLTYRGKDYNLQPYVVYTAEDFEVKPNEQSTS